MRASCTKQKRGRISAAQSVPRPSWLANEIENLDQMLGPRCTAATDKLE